MVAYGLVGQQENCNRIHKCGLNCLTLSEGHHTRVIVGLSPLSSITPSSILGIV